MSARRDRALPSFSDAWRLWREALDAAGLPQRLVSERVALTDAVGRVPARVERTRRPSPTYRAAAMDGFAVHAADVARAAPNRPVRLKVGSRAIPVDTGEAVPDGFDAVIPIEDTLAAGDEIAIAAGIDAGKNVRLPGDDVPPGVAIGWPGRPLRPLDCAALLAGGCTTADVVRRPTVTVIPTGDELVAPGTAARPGAVIESNSAMIACEARLLGAVVHVRTALGDDEARLAGALREAIAASDVVLLLAGSSSGRRDRAAAAIENAGTIVVRGVAMRPARPVILGHAGRVAIVNLPGYPVSCHLAFDAFVAPLLRRLSGVPDTAPRRGRLAEEIATRPAESPWTATGSSRVFEYAS